MKKTTLKGKSVKSFNLNDTQKKALMKALENEETNKFHNWKPEKSGEVLIGKVKEIRNITAKQGKKTFKSQTCLVETSSGETSFFLKTVLKNQFKEKNIKVGSLIAIKYLGKVKDYENYVVVTM